MKTIKSIFLALCENRLIFFIVGVAIGCNLMNYIIVKPIEKQNEWYVSDIKFLLRSKDTVLDNYEVVKIDTIKHYNAKRGFYLTVDIMSQSTDLTRFDYLSLKPDKNFKTKIGDTLRVKFVIKH
jgi:hypothetical protein